LFTTFLLFLLLKVPLHFLKYYSSQTNIKYLIFISRFSSISISPFSSIFISCCCLLLYVMKGKIRFD